MLTEINWVEKFGLAKALEDEGYIVEEVFVNGIGTWYVHGDQAVADACNAFIQSYDGVAPLKEVKKKELRQESLAQYNAVYGDEVFLNPGQVELLKDQGNSFQTKNPMATRLTTVQTKHQKYKDKLLEIESLTTEQELYDYDLKAGW